jgi:hypothetical protein
MAFVNHTITHMFVYIQENVVLFILSLCGLSVCKNAESPLTPLHVYLHRKQGCDTSSVPVESALLQTSNRRRVVPEMHRIPCWPESYVNRFRNSGGTKQVLLKFLQNVIG